MHMVDAVSFRLRHSGIATDATPKDETPSHLRWDVLTRWTEAPAFLERYLNILFQLLRYALVTGFWDSPRT